MMHLIAHRGLMEGPDKDKENDPYQISYALSKGFDAEIDLWVVNNILYLGHDEPKHQIEYKFLQTKQHHLWVHAKNFEALNFLTEFGDNFFWHETDKFVITNTGHIWTYPGNKLGINSVCVMPEEYMKDLTEVKKLECYGICSDYIGIIKEILEDN